MKALSPDTLAGRLTRSLTLWVGSVWLACVLGVVWYIGSEIDYNFDSELVEVSHRMFDIALDHIDDAAPQGDSAAAAAATLPLPIAAPASFADSAVPFQIVNDSARVLARSAGTPAVLFDVPLDALLGVSLQRATQRLDQLRETQAHTAPAWNALGLLLLGT